MRDRAGARRAACSSMAASPSATTHAVQTLSELPLPAKWREYDPEDTIRFYALRLHELGFIKNQDPAEHSRRRHRLALSQRNQTRAEGVITGRREMAPIQTRRHFLTTIGLAGAAALIQVGPALAVEGPPETAAIRLAQIPGICIAPQYIADELLRRPKASARSSTCRCRQASKERRRWLVGRWTSVLTSRRR